MHSIAKRLRRGRLIKLFPALVLGLSLAIGVAACGGGDGDGDSASKTINLVAYSTPQEVYADKIIPAFQATEAGKGVEVTTSFAGSGDSRRAVESGIPTDVVHLPIEPDMKVLKDKNLIPADYRDNEFGGSPQTSVVVFVTRPGNPLGIKDWDDLLEGDIEVINANPFTSGGARWNVVAAYANKLQNGGTEEEALEFTRKLFERIPVQDASARDALNTFLSGKGDVLLSYENEAIAAQNAGEEVDYVVPDTTIVIETLASVATEAENPEGAQAFLDFLYSDEAQRLWAEGGYRPVKEEILAEYSDKFPIPPNLYTIEDLGGWDAVMADLFDVENGKIAEIQRSNGVPVE